jgi:hypothetical protein
MKIDGACHCGFITFEAEVDPEKVAVCHCADCQTLSGAPYRASIPTTPDKFRLLSGEPTIYVKTAESGNKRVQAFCPRCGSPIYATAFNDPTAILNIRVGIIHQRDQLVPKRQVWGRSRQSWVDNLASILRLEKQSA